MSRYEKVKLFADSVFKSVLGFMGLVCVTWALVDFLAGYPDVALLSFFPELAPTFLVWSSVLACVVVRLEWSIIVARADYKRFHPEMPQVRWPLS